MLRGVLVIDVLPHSTSQLISNESEQLGGIQYVERWKHVECC